MAISSTGGRSSGLQTYASTDETAARSAFAAQLTQLVSQIGAGGGSRVADASLRALAGDLMRAVRTYDPHSASVTRVLGQEVTLLAQAVQARQTGNLSALRQLQQSLQQVMPGEESLSHANAANQATMANLLRDAGQVGRDAVAEMHGQSANPSDALAGQVATALQPLLDRLAATSPKDGLQRLSEEWMQAIGGDLLTLSRGAESSPDAQQAIRRSIADLQAAASSPDSVAALDRLGQDIAPLEQAGASLVPLRDDLAMARHYASIARPAGTSAAIETPGAPGGRSAPGDPASSSLGPAVTADTTSNSSAEAYAWRCGRFWGDNHECVSLTRAVCPGLPPSSEWKQGQQVKGNLALKPGTPIATFNFNGKFGPPDHPGGWYKVSHTGIYLGQNAEGVKILHQWNNKAGGAGIEIIPWDVWNGNTHEAGDKYFTIA